MTTSSSSSSTAIDLANPSSLPPYFTPIIRLANEIESERPRVAYLCRFHALEMARILYPYLTKRVGSLMVHLLRRLERDDAASLACRVENTDALEIQSYHQQCFGQYIRALYLGNQADRSQTQNLGQRVALLYEVRSGVNSRELVEVSPEIIAAVRDFEMKNETGAPSNAPPTAQADAGASQTASQVERDPSEIQDGNTGIGSG